MEKKLEIDYLLIKDYLDQRELGLIQSELDGFLKGNKLKDPRHTASAKKDGVIRKKNRGAFLHEIYTNPLLSSIMTEFVRKMFKGTTAEYANKSFWNGGMSQTNFCTNLVSYYEDGDEYLPHKDQSIATALLWLWKEPKSFSGGDFRLVDIDETITVTNNTLIIFPGHCYHEALPVKMEPNSPPGYGRWCISTFFMITPEAHHFFTDFLTR